MYYYSLQIKMGLKKKNSKCGEFETSGAGEEAIVTDGHLIVGGEFETSGAGGEAIVTDGHLIVGGEFETSGAAEEAIITDGTSPPRRICDYN
jgi:hypothetical protein